MWVAIGMILERRADRLRAVLPNPQAYLANPLEILYVWRGGMAFHGGLSGRWWRWRCSRAARAAVPADPRPRRGGRAHRLFFGRIANFVNGELWGRPAPDFPWRWCFPMPATCRATRPKLFEAAAQGLVLFAVMLIAVAIAGLRKPGLIAGVFGIGYGARADRDRVSSASRTRSSASCFGREVDALSGGVTMGMVLSIPLGRGGIVLVLVARSGATRRGALADREASPRMTEPRARDPGDDRGGKGRSPSRATWRCGLGHPRLGYYMTREPDRMAGDFVTAPEISQMFGKLVGPGGRRRPGWTSGSPAPFALVELGRAAAR